MTVLLRHVVWSEYVQLEALQHTEKCMFIVSLPLQLGLLISLDSFADRGWPVTLGTIQGV